MAKSSFPQSSSVEAEGGPVLALVSLAFGCALLALIIMGMVAFGNMLTWASLCLALFSLFFFIVYDMKRRRTYFWIGIVCVALAGTLAVSSLIWYPYTG